MAWMTPFVDGILDVKIVLSLTFTFPTENYKDTN